jgi:hypothetical protein
MRLVRNSTETAVAPKRFYVGAREGLQIAGARAGLIDTRLVRAELVRLRTPRLGTPVYVARAVSSTVAGRS